MGTTRLNCLAELASTFRPSTSLFSSGGMEKGVILGVWYVKLEADKLKVGSSIGRTASARMLS